MRIEDMKGALPQHHAKKEPAPPKTLTTVWGDGLDPSQVREEYPRPLLVRDRYICLNGLWGCEFTAEPVRPKVFTQQILVPFSSESALSGVRRQLQPGEYLWYERRILVPKAAPDERILLHIEAADQIAVVYINDREVIRHTGGYLPFTADITDALRTAAEEFTLTIRVQDFSDTSFHSRGKQKLHPGGMYYTAQSGLWQSVWMEVVPACYLDNILFDTLPDLTSIRVTLSVSDTAGRPISAEVPGEMGETACIRVYPPTTAFDASESWYQAPPVLEQRFSSMQFSLNIPHPKLWSPETPWIYPVEIQLGQDRVRSYCAMRTFAAQRDRSGIMRVLLNGRPVFLNGVLDQGYWPDGLYTAPADEALVHDIVQMKRLGFNMLRKHAKIECRRWYYHCDRLGMIVWQDMVNGGGNYSALLLTYLPTGLCVPGPRMRRPDKARRTASSSAPDRTDHRSSLAERLEYRITSRTETEGRAEFRRECAGTVELLRGYPCIMTWVLFNEGWGQFETRAMTDLVRSLDPMRLIDSASGWFEHKTGDFKSVHNYFRTLKVPKDIRANVLSEYGGYVYHIEEHSMFETTYGYHTCSSAEEFEQSFVQLMTQQVLPLREQGLCGAVYTQVSDIEEETNGLLTYDRRICKISEDGAGILRDAFSEMSPAADAPGGGNEVSDVPA